MKVAVIDYGASNLMSVCNALSKIGQAFEVVADPTLLGDFIKVILPGVGAAGPSMKQLKKTGFAKILPELEVPLLGICLGMQLLLERSEEEETECLSILPGIAKRFPDDLKVPQIGWNQVELMKKNPLLEGIVDGSHFYFVNSYYYNAPESLVLGETLYGFPFASIVQERNFYGVQFHPEKSGTPGMQLLRNFCERC